MPELESALEGFFRHRVRLIGGYTIKLAPTEAGIPDRLVIFPDGHMYLIELKAENGSLSPIQLAWHAKLKARGVHVHTLYGRAHILRWISAAVSAMNPPSKRGCSFDQVG